MPNYCINSLIIEGDAKKIQELVDEAQKGDDARFFQLIKPMPKELEGTTSPSDTPNWYGWRCDNWGTKWDACYIDVVDANEGYACFNFDTAWSPPIPVYDALTEQGLSVTAEYEEHGMGFAGEYINGEDSHWDLEEEEEEELTSTKG